MMKVIARIDPSELVKTVGLLDEINDTLRDYHIQVKMRYKSDGENYNFYRSPYITSNKPSCNVKVMEKITIAINLPDSINGRVL